MQFPGSDAPNIKVYVMNLHTLSKTIPKSKFEINSSTVHSFGHDMKIMRQRGKVYPKNYL